MAKIRLSTGLVKNIMSVMSVQDSFNSAGMAINIYGKASPTPLTQAALAATVPASADAEATSLSAQLIVTIVNTSGPNLDFVFSSPILQKPDLSVWSGSTNASVDPWYPSFFRIGKYTGGSPDTDAADASGLLVRLQGDIGTTLTEAGMITAGTIVGGSTQGIDIFRIALPNYFDS